MNLESEIVFITGPGGAGKSTTGKLLAEKIGYRLVDVDLEFNSRIAMIPDYVREHGYVGYCQRNSRLVDELVVEFPNRVVMPLPSGFLVHEESPELVKKHLALLAERGVSILLLPSRSLTESVEIIVQRQLSRWEDMEEKRQREVITRRHPIYKQYGDIQIFSHQAPEVIVELMAVELKKLGLPK